MTTYRNPIARDGDFADPFVLRHDGRYYLYCTNPDVRCWSSSDLLSWRAEGPTVGPDEFPGLVPFAPEVVYADGAFYMYTSPSGHGHYVLRAESPTGPFRRISGNVGHAIDGNVLIDDDGRWYFYWAGDEGIWGCTMPSPTEFGEPVFTGIHMNGWTEGPFVSKRDGRYFMTLTGNHYLSAGYRIDAASSEHPLTGYVADPLNPILISTAEGFQGLGHSSSVIGPDLVSTYLVYHNLNPDRSRDLDLDRQVWNDRCIQVLGPSSVAPAPAAPDLTSDGLASGWEREEGGLVAGEDRSELEGDRAVARWTDGVLGRVFTAELNLTARRAARYGLSLVASAGTVTLLVDSALHQVVLIGADGWEATADLPAGFAHDALHCWVLMCSDGQLELRLDGRRQLATAFAADDTTTVAVVALGGGVAVGHCAATRSTHDEAQRHATAVVPGRFWATLSPGAVGSLVRDAAVAYASVALAPGQELPYRLQVQEAGETTVSLIGSFAPGDVLGLRVGGSDERVARVGEEGRVVVVPMEFSAGVCTLVVRALGGRPTLSLLSVDPAPAPNRAQLAEASIDGFGKELLDPAPRQDAVVTAEVVLDTVDGHGDLLLRASDLAEGGEGDDTRLGIDFFRGYSVQFHADRVVLARHDYDERLLAEHSIPIGAGAPHAVRIRLVADAIAVEVDGVRVIEAVDPLPHLSGGMGIRSAGARIRVRGFAVDPKVGES